MYKRDYLDPLGGSLPALERNVIRLRSMEMVLVLFYAERLRRKIIGLIQRTDSLHASFDGEHKQRVPKGTKDTLRKCLDALFADEAITSDEREELKRLLDYRNVVAHDIHQLTADVSHKRFIREYVQISPDSFSTYDYDAVNRLRYYLDLLSKKEVSLGYVGTFSMNIFMFESTEKTLLADIKRLNARIERQMAERKLRIRDLNGQLAINDTQKIEEHPDHPLNQYDNKRLTKRGEEICYRLLDQGKSAMAVAHLMGISLASARKRRKMWQAAGGNSRPPVDLNVLPHRKFYRRYDD